jgi:hypothetical protein
MRGRKFIFIDKHSNPCTGGCSGGTPEAPTLVTADSQITATWAAVDGATIYQVYDSTKDDSSTGNLIGAVTEAKCVINGLTNGTTYYIWIKAQNNAGSSDFSPVASATPAASLVAPAAPVYVSITVGDSSLTVTWPSVTGADSYEVWYNTKNDITAASQVGGDITDLTYTIPSLKVGTYYVWVRAKNKVGTGPYSQVQSATINALAAPTILNATTGTGTITISWYELTNAMSYEVWYGTTTDVNSASRAGGDITGTSYTITGLTNGLTYSIWVRGKSSAGAGNFGPVKTIQIPYTGVITGLVNFSSSDSYSVTLCETGSSAFYSNSAYFTFKGLSPGTYHVRIERNNYQSILKEIALGANQTVDLGTFTITTPVPAETTVTPVSAKLNTGNGSQNFTIDCPFSQTVNVSYAIYASCANSAVAPVSVTGVTITGPVTLLPRVSIGTSNPAAVEKKDNFTASAPAGTYTISIGSNYNGGGWAEVDYKNISGQPKISLSKYWCNTSGSDQTAISCSDSPGIQQVQYVITNSMDEPTGGWITIAANTAVRFNNSGVWFLHVQCISNANTTTHLLSGPYIITQSLSSMRKVSKTLKK